MVELILKYWPVFSVMIVWTIGLVIYIIRLEGKVKANTESIKDFKKQCEENVQEQKARDEKLDKTFDKFDNTFDKLFDLSREIKSSVDKLIGWKDAKTENGG